MAKTEKRIIARKLRKQGKSLRYIANQIQVSKSSVSIWCSDIILSQKQQRKLIQNSVYGQKKGSMIAAKNKRIERIHRMNKLKKKGKNLINHLSSRDLLVIGTALYWAEGTKTNRRTVFSNSDPSMIKLYLAWLTNCMNISHSRLKCYVGINHIHNHRVQEVEQYWSEITGISLDNFTKTSIKKVTNKKTYPNKDRHCGTLTIEVKSGTNLNYQILGQIEALKLLPT